MCASTRLAGLVLRGCCAHGKKKICKISLPKNQNKMKVPRKIIGEIADRKVGQKFLEANSKPVSE
jgi:hypothetical protein